MAKVVKETKESHVQIFGDQSFSADFAGAFEGDAKDKRGYLRGDAKVQVRTGVDARASRFPPATALNPKTLGDVQRDLPEGEYVQANVGPQC